MILNEIAQNTIKRVSKDKENISSEDMKAKALSLPKGNFEFEKALRGQKVAIISEVKKASPSKGIISKDFPYLQTALEYEKVGATCISVLTEPKWFLGSDEIFKEIRQNVKIPLLRKDFTIDEYQIYQAKVMGANCVLLIVALLSQAEIEKYIEICNTLGINALVETHDEKEIETAIKAGAKIIGVNNRNLKDFSVNLNNASELKKHIPQDVIYIAESGILNTYDGINLVKNGANALLIGEALMKTDDKAKFIKEIMEYKYD